MSFSINCPGERFDLNNNVTSELIFNPSDPLNWADRTKWCWFNPRWPEDKLKILLSATHLIESLDEDLWVSTSGSQSGVGRWVGFQKRAFLEAAQGLSLRFKFEAGEGWVKVLPSFHVGGLAIWARSEVAKQKVIELEQWQPKEFCLRCEEAQWSSLVPTQVFDLVDQNLKAPKSLRGIFVGGASLKADLYQRGRALGWPLLPSFGMTEAASQVATASLSSLFKNQMPPLKLMSHLQAKVVDHLLYLKGAGLASTILTFGSDGWSSQPALDHQGWLKTEDLVELMPKQILVPKGRLENWVKIRGELVSRSEIEQRFAAVAEALGLKTNEYALDLKQDSRSGYVVCLYLESKNWPLRNELLSQWQLSAAPFERVERVYQIDEIPRSDLGKILYAKLPG